MQIARSFQPTRPFHWPLDIRFMIAAAIALLLGIIAVFNQWHVFMPLALHLVYSFMWLVGFTGTFEGKLGLVTLVPLLGLFAFSHYVRGDRWQTVVYLAAAIMYLFCSVISFAVSLA